MSGFLPYIRIPVLYIFPASHVIKMNVSISITSDTATCQYGTPNGILIIMEIGDVNGIMESHIPKLLSGLFTMAVEHTIATIKGNDTMVLNWLLSVSLSTIPPMAANMALRNVCAYRRHVAESEIIQWSGSRERRDVSQTDF